jgi:oxygen-independent coproporphyrinogen-3 oxidase
MDVMPGDRRPLGLYVHIPFCAKLCHYCDFAKTANFNDDHVARYLDVLGQQFQMGMRCLPTNQKLTSVYFGGGTPGLLTQEYEFLMRDIMSMTVPQAEVTIEANPINVSQENILIWRDLGFNRLSLGVQTFDPTGLKVLTRDHSAQQALQALELTAKGFPKSNGDLIYGWNGQTETSWFNDLSLMASSGVNHISAYALTYEGQTPFARSQRRGILQPMHGDDVAHRYDMARKHLANQGFTHEEVSNWSKPGGEGQHNWIYWRGQHYIGIGAGAHGFVDDGRTIGLRYSYPGDFRSFLRQGSTPGSEGLSLNDVIKATGGVVDQDRDAASWVYEYVGSGIRCQDGVDLDRLKNVGFELMPNEILQRGIAEGLLRIDAGHLKASEGEWFRETAWSYQIILSLTGPTSCC